MRTSFSFILSTPFLALFFLLIASSARGQFTGGFHKEESEFAGGEVIAVNFEGNRQISSDELSTVAATSVTSWFSRIFYYFPYSLLRFLGEPYQTLEFPTLQRDTQSINNYYRDRGLIDARSSYRVSPNIEDVKKLSNYIRQQRLTKNSSSGNSTGLPEIRDTVTFVISEGQPYAISRIAIEGLESLPNQFQPELTEHVTIKTGERWSRVVAAKEVQRLMSILIENGYPDVRYDSLVVEHTQGLHTVNVLIYFHAGHRYKYGPVHIVFDTTAVEKSRVADEVILAQLYTDSGHWYQLSAVQRSELSLARLGTFDLARVSLDTTYISHIPDSLRDSVAVPVQVFLRMKPRIEMQFGIFGGEGIQGFVFGTSIGYANKNLFQAADNLNIQVSWQPFPFSQQRYSGNIDYLRPYVGLGRIPIIMGVGYSEQDQFSVPGIPSIYWYNQTSYTVHAGSAIILSKTDNRTSLNPDGQIAYVVSTGASEIVDSLPKTQINLLPGITYQDDRRNDPLNPTAGDLISAHIEVGLPSSGLFGKPSSNYWQISPQVKNYFDLTGRGSAVIATRLHFGFSWMFDLNNTQDDPSLDHRFYGGGGSSERGWGEQALIVSHVPTRPANQGGYNDLEANVEFRYAPFQYAGEFTDWQKYSSPIRIVLFYDAGNVWDNLVQQSPRELSISQVAQTVGFGLRYNLFFGALRIDFGFKLYDPSGTFSNEASSITPGSKGLWLWSRPANIPLLSIGNTCNVHFGIGQAF